MNLSTNFGLIVAFLALSASAQDLSHLRKELTNLMPTAPAGLPPKT